jgi:hypothetical protein
MQTQLSISNQTSRLRAEISAIADTPKANGEMASKAAVALIACWPGQQAQDPMVAKAYMRALTELLLGQDLDVIQSLLGDFVRKQDFLPSVAKVADFIDGKMQPKRSRIDWCMAQLEILEREAEPDVPEEERRRNLQMLKDVSQLIKDTANTTRRASPPLPAWQATEEEAIKGRAEGLKNLEAMRKTG